MNQYDSIYIYDGCKINTTYIDISHGVPNWIARIYLGASSLSTGIKIINNSGSYSSLSTYFRIVNYANGLKDDGTGELK